MQHAVIDVGTNTVLLLVAAHGSDGEITTLLQEQRVIRVGEGILTSHTISRDAEARLSAALSELSTIVRSRFGAIPLCIFGTSVFRRARNAHEVVDRVRISSGCSIEILSGDDEARWTFVGALPTPAFDRECVIDIGGGSTEIVVGMNDTILFSESVDIGVVVLREQFFQSYPPQESTLLAARTFLAEALASPVSSTRALSPRMITAVAGTPTTLAALALGLVHYDAMKVDGSFLSADVVAAQSASLLHCTEAELRAMPGVDPRRADVLPGGALLLHTFLTLMGAPGVRVSDRGVRYGIAMREWRARS